MNLIYAIMLCHKIIVWWLYFLLLSSMVKLIYFSSSALLYNICSCNFAVEKEIREKLSGAVEAFSRKNHTSSSPHVDYTRRRTFEDVAVHKDPVILFFKQ